MKHFTFDNRWDEVKGQLKQRYGQLTDDDLTFAEGKGEELLARLREKLNLSGSDLDTVLNDLHTQASSGIGQVKAKLNDLAADARDKASTLAADLKSRAAVVGEEAKVKAAAVYDDALVRAKSLREEGEEYVRHNPRESLVAALCAGFVTGLLIFR